jgi:hypothetical protein
VGKPFDRVVIGPHTISVEFVDRVSKRKVGLAERSMSRILIGRDQSLANQKSTVLHELDHMGFWLSPMRFVKGWSDEMEEAAITALELPRLELFTRPENRPARDYLTG